jgi:hypothetical protein
MTALIAAPIRLLSLLLRARWSALPSQPGGQRDAAHGGKGGAVFQFVKQNH